MKIAHLKTRGVLKVEGPEAQPFLQKLFTQDLNFLSESQALYGAFLTPQGRYFADCFICKYENNLYLELTKELIQPLIELLTRYRMRSKLSIQEVSHIYSSFSVWGQEEGMKSFDLLPIEGMCRKIEESFAFVDPRLHTLGIRVLATNPTILPLQGQATENDYALFRTKMGISEAQQELVSGKSIILEHGFADLNGISWKKGCYPGQELMARTFHRGQINKRTFPVQIIGPAPSPGSLILHKKKEIGKILSHVDNHGIALLFVASMQSCGQDTAHSGKTILKPYVLPWMHLTK